MRVLHIQDHTGHTVLEFDEVAADKIAASRIEDVSPEDRKAVYEAMAAFDDIVAKGGKVVTRKAGESKSHIAKNFADMQDESTTLWQRQGG